MTNLNVGRLKWIKTSQLLIMVLFDLNFLGDADGLRKVGRSGFTRP